MDSTPDAVLVYALVRDRRGRAAAFRRRLTNRAAEKLLADLPPAMLGILPEYATDDIFDNYATLVVGGRPVSLDKVIPDPAGGVAACFSVEARSLRDEALLLRITDVTARARAGLRWKAHAERLALLARRSSDALAVLDADGQIVWVSESASTVLQRVPDDLVGTNLRQLVADAHVVALEGEGGRLRREGRVRVQAPPRAEGAEPRWLEVTLETRDGTSLALLRDITSLRQLEGTVAELTGSAGLPGVVTRKVFAQQLLKEIARRQRYGRTVSVVALTLDGRTALRDAGVLGDAQRALAEVAVDMLRVADVMGAWNDDVFLLLLPETPVPGGVRACERLNERLGTHTLVSLPKARLSVSAGVAAVDFGDDVKQVLTRALQGMASLRRRGPGNVGIAQEKNAA